MPPISIQKVSVYGQSVSDTGQIVIVIRDIKTGERISVEYFHFSDPSSFSAY